MLLTQPKVGPRRLVLFVSRLCLMQVQGSQSLNGFGNPASLIPRNAVLRIAVHPSCMDSRVRSLTRTRQRVSPRRYMGGGLNPHLLTGKASLVHHQCVGMDGVCAMPCESAVA